MFKNKVSILLLSGMLAGGISGCVPLEQQGQGYGSSSTTQATLRYEDFIYDESIRSVQCYRASGTPEEVLNPAVLPLTQEQPVMLKFDRVNAGPQRLLVKVHHCNANWTPSGLNVTQYLNDFNEFFITDVQNSVSTRVPYVHYTFRVPRVKISGNYVVEVTEEGGNVLLSRRMLVYENAVAVAAKLGAPAGPSGRFSRQPVEFNIFYKDFPLVNPAQEIKVVMRQNHRWDNAKSYPQPTFVRDEARRLEYVFFEPKDHFMGLSEFRVFDTRSIRFRGLGVQGINLEANPIVVNLQQDKTRQGEVYSQDPDADGKLLFGNREYGNGDVNGDYAWVEFELRAPEETKGNVYLQGALTDWRLTEQARMRYNQERGAYVGRLLLKQGYYNYYYALAGGAGTEADASYFEGSHFGTGNTYDILVYYRPPGTRADRLVGYEEIGYNRKF
ncbi:DUF5103 domain-containing protein [Pontibacter qinzhouensis]|uniref:DUF5103 domain-containing protein n=1 Tax=Pontibacter qinzhouensis TaxID=2603253 RepID=A0A5C8JHU1_9BACT|nr:DUF5103 domain-containing protein [Pontibacter qinzhouensis]TXK36962.1 DUF5103 domain-containing protein [Pontibacter qinzhouensis]